MFSQFYAICALIYYKRFIIKGCLFVRMFETAWEVLGGLAGDLGRREGVCRPLEVLGGL